MKKTVMYSIAAVITVAAAIGVKNLYDNKIKQSYESGLDAGKTALIKAQNDFKSSPVFSPDLDWNSEQNRIYLEYDIRVNTATKDGPINMFGAACYAATVINQWHCVARKTGQVLPQIMIVEVDPKNGYWSTVSLF
jgi:hypothetical protein